MTSFYPKKWFIVPHDEYPASKTLPLGQLISGITTISHSLNRKTLVAPPPSEINETFQTNFDLTAFKIHGLHANLGVSSPLAPASLEAGGGVDGNNNLTFKADVVQTQTFSPSDDYAKASFQASQKESEMVNHLKKSPMTWNRKVFMITGRKVGKAMTLNRDEVAGFEQKAKIGFNVEQAATVQANLDMNWKKSLKIGSLTEQPCVFAVQLRRVKYHADPRKPVTTEDFVKNAVMGKDDDERDEEEEDMELTFDRMDDEGPRVDKYDFDTVVMTGLDGGEEEFLVETDD
jgi:hypothetical protein